jgi:large subunit ribosomal protein L24
MGKSIRRGDRVLVIAGNDRGKSGEVLGRSEDRVLVQGVNIRKKHMKRTQQTQGGRIIEMESPIHVSNVCLCDKDGNRLKAPVKDATESKRAAKKVKNV